ncbi:MAG TPA: ATP-dependent Clp protease ATP-binding subunit [Candidatus Paceibacterota bacterium]|nr:ATP-dependent Clp protease ATP-binding subunit [Candidatus Paceibacterota bacterium]
MYFKEPKLNLSTFGEVSFRVVSYISYTVLTVAAVFSLLSQDPNLKALGALIILFVGDKLLHLNEGRKTITTLTKKHDKGDNVNIAKSFTPSAYKTLSQAYRKSLNLNKNFYLLLFKDLIKNDKGSKEALKRLNISQKEILDKLNKLESETKNNQTKTKLQNFINDITKKAFYIADHTSEEYVHPRNLFAALTQSENPTIEKILNIFDINLIDLREAIIFSRFQPKFAGIKKIPASFGGFAHQSMFIRKRIMNRAWTARPTPFLDKLSDDLTAKARQEQTGLLIGHQKEYRQLINTLSRVDKPNALLVGEPGTGKSTLTAHLAYKIIKDEIPENLFDKRLVRLNIGSLLAKAESKEIANRLKKIAQEITTAGNIILSIPNIHNLFKSISGSDTSFTAMDILLPVIKSTNTPIIGITYPQEYKKYIEKKSDFIEQFETIKVQEVSREEAIRILIYHCLILENKYNTYITLRAIKKAVYLGYRYLHHKPLPSSALDLIKQSLVRVQQKDKKRLDEYEIIELTQEISNVPIEKAETKEVEKLLNLEKIIHQRLINQDNAVEAVSRALREYRSGLSKEGRPIATFLFVGPTGVGKTELSKILAKIQFGSRNSMIRLDMSEYQDKDSINRLIGSPNGKNSGNLTEAVLEKPYSLILLDEFEKAHPDILNLFLQVFDDGRLTDAMDRTVNFENTIIIATSNAHSNFIKKQIEKEVSVTEISQELKGKLTENFRPELLNRFSNVIVFRSLNKKEINKVAEILINETCQSIKESHGIQITVTKQAIKKISELGYSPVFGARPLREEISKNIRSPLAEKILKNEITRGSVVKISYNQKDKKFKFKAVK